MASFWDLLRSNRNYRYTWIGQVVSEIGDHFNNIAVFSLALANTRSGLVVSGVMLARAIPAVLAGPIAGVLLDRMDRKRIMIASDLIRAVVALGFILTVHRHSTWLLYLLSALLMFASPFFTSGRSRSCPPSPSRRAAHREFADANHAVDHADHRHVPGGGQRGAIRIPVGIHRQCALVCLLRFVHFAAVCARRRLPAETPSAHRKRSGAAVARIRGRAALHARDSADLSASR